MGGLCSSPLQPMTPIEERTVAELRRMALFEDAEIARLFRSYCAIRGKTPAREDLMGIRLGALYKYLRIDRSEFSDQVFLLPVHVAEGGLRPKQLLNSRLNFAGFAAVVWTFCAFELATLAFNMVDKDNKGHLTREEVTEVVAQVCVLLLRLPLPLRPRATATATRTAPALRRSSTHCPLPPLPPPPPGTRAPRGAGGWTRWPAGPSR